MVQGGTTPPYVPRLRKLYAATMNSGIAISPTAVTAAGARKALLSLSMSRGHGRRSPIGNKKLAVFWPRHVRSLARAVGLRISGCLRNASFAVIQAQFQSAAVSQI